MIKARKIYKKKRTYLIIFISAALAAIIAKKTIIPASDANYKDYSEIVERGVLVIAVQNDPMSIHISGNDTAGFAYNVVKDFANDKNLKLEIKTTNSLEEEISTLTFGGCNIIADLIPQTEMTNSRIQLSTPLCSGYAVLVQNENSKSKISRHVQMAKRTITVPKDCPYKARIKNMEKEVQDSVFIREERNKSTLTIIGEMENSPEMLTVCNNHQANALQKEFPYITTMKIGFGQNMSLGIDKNSGNLADTLNTWLDGYMKTERYRTLERQYISK